jgi:poly-beta-hydroxybutyrate-responsive repressor
MHVDTPLPPKAEREREHAAPRVGRSSAPFVLLVLLEAGRSYGYEIRGRLEAFGFRRAVEDPGVLYRLLRQLEEEGSITSEWDTTGSGPARRYYQLTDRGRDRLAQYRESLQRQARRIEQFFELYDRLGQAPAPAEATA